MTNANSARDPGRRERIAAAMIGAFFVVIALALLVSSRHDLSLGPLLAALVIGGLGVDALVSAARRRRCILSRIGPLP